jgi:hypothetical protein
VDADEGHIERERRALERLEQLTGRDPKLATIGHLAGSA